MFNIDRWEYYCRQNDPNFFFAQPNEWPKPTHKQIRRMVKKARKNKDYSLGSIGHIK